MLSSNRWIAGSLNGSGNFLLLLSVIAALGQTATAQTTIFNIPTTDTVALKKAYFEFGYLPQVPKTEGETRTYLFAPRIVVGIAPNTEAGANVFGERFGGEPRSTSIDVQPHIKYKFAENRNKGLAAAAGLTWITPVNQGEGSDSFGLLYGNFSKKVKSSHFGPRFTAGPYAIVGANDNYAGTKAGAILGYEQPVHTKVTVVADWFSGVSGFGFFTTGVSFTLPRASQLNVGYSIGNDSFRDPGNNNRFLFVYYGITFP